jgi:hypothetical protein
VPATGKPITDSNGVEEIIRKFKSKYGEVVVKKYYTKFDVAIEVPIWQIVRNEVRGLNSQITKIALDRIDSRTSKMF